MYFQPSAEQIAAAKASTCHLATPKDPGDCIGARCISWNRSEDKPCAGFRPRAPKQALAASAAIDWYERRHELRPGQVFLTAGGAVKLDRGVPGDGTKWYALDWDDGWFCYDSTIEPGDLMGEPIEDASGAIRAALAGRSSA